MRYEGELSFYSEAHGYTNKVPEWMDAGSIVAEVEDFVRAYHYLLMTFHLNRYDYRYTVKLIGSVKVEGFSMDGIRVQLIYGKADATLLHGWHFLLMSPENNFLYAYYLMSTPLLAPIWYNAITTYY